MSDLQRERFEHYATTRNLNIARKGGGYVSPVTDYDWQAWCAATESVVVELPNHFSVKDVGIVMDAAGVCNAVLAAGVKYK